MRDVDPCHIVHDAAIQQVLSQGANAVFGRALAVADEQVILV